MPVRTLLFDLGNVLVYFSHERMFAQLAKLCDRTPAEVEIFLVESALMAHYDTGLIDDAGFHRALEAWSDRALDANALLRASGDIFHLNEPMPAILDQAREAGLRLVLLSNTCPAHVAWVAGQWPDLLARFDAKVLSYEAGGMKPDAKIFEAALQAIDCAPNECFYTDDIPPYVEAGRSHGLDAEVFVDSHTLLEHLNRRGVSWSKSSAGRGLTGC